MRHEDINNLTVLFGRTCEDSSIERMLCILLSHHELKNVVQRLSILRMLNKCIIGISPEELRRI